MDRKMILSVLAIAVLGFAGTMLLIPEDRDDGVPRLPWLVSTDAPGRSQVFVFTLGAYLLPQILGRPRHWTLSVLITDAAIYQTNLPLAAAMAIFFMSVSLALVAITMKVGKGKKIKTA